MSPKSEETVLIPIAITVFNLFPPNEIATTTPTRLFRPEYTSRLLVQVRLDIYRVEEAKDTDGSIVRKEFILFSAQLDQPSIHPSWYHLEDRLNLAFLDTDSEWPVKFRIVILSEEKETILIDDFPLSPNQLRTLPEHNDDDHQASWGQPRPPPKALPINAVLIQYSDGSTRVHPSLYHLLLQRNIIEQIEPADLSLSSEKEGANEQQAMRFEDKAFATLDKVESIRQPPQQQPEPSMHLENDDEASLSLIPDSSVTAECSLPMPVLPSELDCDVEDLLREKEALTALLQEEQEMLEYDRKLLSEDKDEILVILGQIKSIEKETADIRQYTSKILEEQEHLDLVTEAQRVKLLKDLRAIYPIQCKPDQHYFIRGVELPPDLHVGLVTEDEISAALGYICHSLVMMSKYLSIPLRYRIVCNSSRSAVQEDGSTILPLFQSRLVERDFLDRGMNLLHRNVETLAKSRNVQFGDNVHILAKMKRIYDKIVGGR